MTQTGSTAGDNAQSATPMSTTGQSTAAQPLTRRALREAEAAAARASGVRRRTNDAAPARAAVVRRDTTPARRSTTPTARRGAAAGQGSALVRRSAAARPAVVAPSTPAKASKPARKRKFLPVVVMTLTAGILSTQVLPAIAAQQSVQQADGSSQAAVDAKNLRSTESQSISVADTAALADTTRDAYTATSPQVLAAAKAAAEHAAVVQTARAQTAATYASYTGPTAAEYAAAPKYPDFSLDQVVAVAKQYIGTPYVYGGATPAGFDCSGFVMYVYAQFGISLAHSVPLQDAAGTTIPESEAQPGDVVIFNSEAHDGFYMGNGMIMDAPKPGGSISIRPIWTSDYHIVRFGIN